MFLSFTSLSLYFQRGLSWTVFLSGSYGNGKYRMEEVLKDGGEVEGWGLGREKPQLCYLPSVVPIQDFSSSGGVLIALPLSARVHLSSLGRQILEARSRPEPALCHTLGSARKGGALLPPPLGELTLLPGEPRELALQGLPHRYWALQIHRSVLPLLPELIFCGLSCETPCS